MQKLQNKISFVPTITHHQPSITDSGQSLFEVIIALGVVALVLVGAMSLSTTSIRNSVFARSNTLATKYAQEAVEWLREERDSDWDNFRQNVGERNLGSLTWSSSGCEVGSTDLCRRIESVDCEYYDPGPPRVGPLSRSCSDPTSNLVNVTIEVSWSDGQGDHSVRSATTFSRWK